VGSGEGARGGTIGGAGGAGVAGVAGRFARCGAESADQRSRAEDHIFGRGFAGGKRVTISASDVAVVTAMTEILFRTGLDVAVDRDGTLALVRCQHEASAQQAQDTGKIVGRVTNKAGEPLFGATIAVDRSHLVASTDANGNYTIRDVPTGTYTLRARYIGYEASARSATVIAGEETKIDFDLVKSVQKLDEVVTTGTVIPTEIKALPTPVTVINASDIADQHPLIVPDLFRQSVPGGVSWHVSQSPYGTSYSARGATTLSPGGGQMKVFVDGVEMSNPGRASVDPSSIQSIEVVRGPQAAAIYGSEAIGGVVQIFTKRGSGETSRPQVHLESGVGLVETPYDGFGGVFKQDYRAAIRGEGADVGYNLGAGYSRLGDYLPDGELSRQSTSSVYGGIRHARGPFVFDLSGRYYTQNSPSVVNPALLRTGFVSFSRPFYQTFEVQGQTFGGRISVTPLSWLSSTLRIGVDRYSNTSVGTRPRLTTPDDTLLQVFNETRTKASVGFTTSVAKDFGFGLSGTITAGFDHWNLPLNQFFSLSASRTTGTVSPGPVSATRLVTDNSGYFAQAQVGLSETLFLTAGIRFEHNTALGDSLGAPVSPRIGMSYMRQVGSTMLKVRSSYGRAMRAPAPGQKEALVAPGSVTLANPGLGPERQDGWDVGLDAVFAHGTSISATYYDQTAENLIQFVQVGVDTLLTFQYQNVGRLKNTGVEIEAATSLGPVDLRANYAYTRSRIKQLAPAYRGDLRIGDQSLATPTHTTGVAVSVVPRDGTGLAGGLTYVGSWSNYDQIALLSCFGGTGRCQPDFRGYITEYPGFIKINASITQRIRKRLVMYASVNNITDNEAYELGNEFPVLGRTTILGLQLHY
jgi:outer membrane receptor protein involved in Fe transport